jgi:hypothetical protein
LEGKFFTVGDISDDNIADAAVFMSIAFETEELQLQYHPNAAP